MKKYAVEGLMGYPNELAYMLDEANEQNAELRAALRVTQESARMAALAVDVRMTLNPNKAVEFFNSMFPEVAKALAQVKEE